PPLFTVGGFNEAHKREVPARNSSPALRACGPRSGRDNGRGLTAPHHPGPEPPMSDVTRILSALEQGDPHAAEQLLPIVYDELRQLAAQKLAQEKPGQTLQATALVHEAYLRLVDVDNA